MVILPYQKEFKPRLLEIFRLNTPQYFAPEEQGDFEAYLQENSNTYFIIKSLGTIAGSGGYSSNGHIGRLTWDMLDPNFRGQGLGKTLINFCIDKILQNGSITKIDVRTSQNAHEFYSKFGFNIVEHKKDFWGTGLDLYHMQRPA